MKPIYETLTAYRAQNRISFAMPGHKMKKSSPVIDVTELPRTIDLHHPNPPITASSEWLADVYGSDKSLYLAGGSTSGIFTLIGSVCRPGSLLAVCQGCHQSVLNACTLFGTELLLLPQKLHPVLGVFEPVTPQTLKNAFLQYPQICGVLITSPDYFGRCTDIASLSRIAHQNGVPLLVDEAHGAHFIVGAPYPSTALSQGADGAVQSAHKTLTAMTPAAMLHIKQGLLDPDLITRTAAMVQTSSPPSYVIASCEQAVEELICSTEPWTRLAKKLLSLNERLRADTDIFIPSGGDPSRITMNFSAYDTTGTEIARRLDADYGIDIELSDLYNIVAIATPQNTETELETLYRAACEIAATLSPSAKTNILPPVSDENLRLSPSRAFFADTCSISFPDACGKTAASAIAAYPPGIPVIYPGQKVTKDRILYLQALKDAGITLSGEKEFTVVSSKEDPA